VSPSSRTRLAEFRTALSSSTPPQWNECPHCCYKDFVITLPRYTCHTTYLCLNCQGRKSRHGRCSATWIAPLSPHKHCFHLKCFTLVDELYALDPPIETGRGLAASGSTSSADPLRDKSGDEIDPQSELQYPNGPDDPCRPPTTVTALNCVPSCQAESLA
jgi:hypothetical protein